MTKYNYVRRKSDGLYLASAGGYTDEPERAFVFTEVLSFMNLANNADYEVVPLTEEPLPISKEQALEKIQHAIDHLQDVDEDVEDALGILQRAHITLQHDGDGKYIAARWSGSKRS